MRMTNEEIKFLEQELAAYRAMITVGRNNSYLAENHGRVSNVYSNPIYRGEWPIVRKRKLEGDWYCLMSPSGSQYFQWI